MRQRHKEGRGWLGWLVPFFLGAALALCCQAFIRHGLGSTDNPPSLFGSATSHPRQPWGALDCEPLLLEPNELQPYLQKTGRPERWVFQGYSAAQLKTLFSQCGLADSARQFLLDSNHWEASSNGFAITVPDDIVLGLGPAGAQHLYPVLAGNPANLHEYFPVRMPLDGFDERFANSGLTPATLERIRQLTYTNAGWLCFSAGEQLRNTLPADEVRNLIRVLYRVPAVRLRVRITPESDVESLIAYWGQGGRSKVVRPLIEAVARKPAGGSLPVTYFLPPYARLRLYTYPDPATDPATPNEDCFFTALNFNHEPADLKLLDREVARQVLMRDYAPVRGQPTLGDLLLFLDAAGNGIHVCVFIADDVVFTKDGATALEPWVLMRIQDLRAYYPPDRAPRLVYLRRRAT